MIWWVRVCVDAKGLEGLLERGRCYFVRDLPLGAVKLRNGLIVSGARFTESEVTR